MKSIHIHNMKRMRTNVGGWWTRGELDPQPFGQPPIRGHKVCKYRGHKVCLAFPFCDRVRQRTVPCRKVHCSFAHLVPIPRATLVPPRVGGCRVSDRGSHVAHNHTFAKYYKYMLHDITFKPESWLPSGSLWLLPPQLLVLQPGKLLKQYPTVPGSIGQP